MTDAKPLDFAADAPAAPAAPRLPWKVLVVDDDEEVHAVTRLMFDNFVFEGRPMLLLHAYSAAQARQQLAAHDGIALALLDVVMESEHAGLDLVRHIRQELGNRSIRIALRTGQPGQAPAQQVITQYDIDDYVPKSELRFQRLYILVTSALRTFSLLRRLETQQAELQRINAELERYAYCDPLTGLMNRRRFEQAIEGEWRRAQRHRLPLAALMIDVDYFKAYNDNYGHPAGDRILQQLAKVLVEHFRRAGDSVCRYGGEEFVALLPGTTPAEGVALAEGLRDRIQALAEVHACSPHGVVTASVGVAFADPAQEATADGYQRLIKAADEALYRAKNKGRNRVESGAAA